MIAGAPVRPRVSVLVPVYNGGNHVGTAIDSILAQTFEDFELVVVDDGSTDNTADELRKRRSDGRLRIIHLETNQGLVAALNAGLARCQGELVARLDADDVALPRRLEQQVQCFDENPGLTLCATAYFRVHPDGTAIRVGTPPLSHGAMAMAMLRGNRINHSTAMFRRADVIRYGGYDTAWFPVEDYDLWLRILARGRYVGLDEPSIRCVESPGGISRTHAERQTQLINQRLLAYRDETLGLTRSQRSLTVRDVARMSSYWRRELARGETSIDGLDDQAWLVALWLTAGSAPIPRLGRLLVGAPRLVARRVRPEVTKLTLASFWRRLIGQ